MHVLKEYISKLRHCDFSSFSFGDLPGQSKLREKMYLQILKTKEMVFSSYCLEIADQHQKDGGLDSAQAWYVQFMVNKSQPEIAYQFYHNYGVCLARLEKYDKSLQSFFEALLIKPKAYATRENFAWTLFLARQFNGSLHQFQAINTEVDLGDDSRKLFCRLAEIECCINVLQLTVARDLLLAFIQETTPPDSLSILNQVCLKYIEQLSDEFPELRTYLKQGDWMHDHNNEVSSKEATNPTLSPLPNLKRGKQRVKSQDFSFDSRKSKSELASDPSVTPPCTLHSSPHHRRRNSSNSTSNITIIRTIPASAVGPNKVSSNDATRPHILRKENRHAEQKSILTEGSRTVTKESQDASVVLMNSALDTPPRISAQKIDKIDLPANDQAEKVDEGEEDLSLRTEENTIITSAIHLSSANGQAATSESSTGELSTLASSHVSNTRQMSLAANASKHFPKTKCNSNNGSAQISRSNSIDSRSSTSSSPYLFKLNVVDILTPPEAKDTGSEDPNPTRKHITSTIGRKDKLPPRSSGQAQEASYESKVRMPGREILSSAASRMTDTFQEAAVGYSSTDSEVEEWMSASRAPGRRPASSGIAHREKTALFRSIDHSSSSCHQLEQQMDSDTSVSGSLSDTALEGGGNYLQVESFREASPTMESVTVFYPYEDLIAPGPYPEGICIRKREIYLAEQDFQQVLGVRRSDWEALPKWKQIHRKRETGLF